MRIAYVFATFDAGGPQVRMTGLLNSLPHTYEHRIVAMDGRFGAAERLDTRLDVELVEPPPRGWARAWHMTRLIKGLGADLLFTHNWGALDALMARPLGARLPWIHMETGFEADERDAFKRRRTIARRVILRRAARVVVPSHRLVEIARTLWRVASDRLHYVANGVDLGAFTPGSAPGLRHELQIPADAVVIGTIANLRPVKNPLRLLTAFATCVAGHDTYLVFVGDNGRLLSSIQAAARQAGILERVRFVGRQTDVADYHRMFDIFALSSDSEQSPVSVLEAMATARPVLSTDVGDVRINVASSNQGFIVPTGNDEGYATALRTLATDASLRQEIGRANHARAHADFGQDLMIRRYSQLISSVIDESASEA